MLPLVLALSLAASHGASPLTRSRDVATIPGAEDVGAPSPELAKLPDDELERRLAALRRQNSRAFSDARALRIHAIEAELERRRQERDWDEEERRREARQAAETARLEAEHAAAVRARAADEETRAAVANARTAAERAEQAEAEAQAADRRRAAVRWTAFGVLGAAALGLGLAARRRRG